MKNTDPYQTRMRSGKPLPQIPARIDPVEALTALRRCFNESGVLAIKPESSQFRPVGQHERAISILEACDIAIQTKAEPPRRALRGGYETRVSVSEIDKALAELKEQGQGTMLDRPAAILHGLRRAASEANGAE